MARPRNRSTMTVERLRAVVAEFGGQRATARVLGVSPASIARYLTGRGVPPEIAMRLETTFFDRKLAAGAV